ncbi:MAG TPA: protein phosphatase 2C domain-containing protein [Acidobacteriaceae bacterium]|nr:protein phosphatase 2C domain-containing protein [Acidobacteriaceae bacterium]
MLDIIYGQATDAGRRSENEDAMGVYAPRSRGEIQARGWIFAVADGVGGLSAGEVASATAVQVLVDGFARAEEQTSLASLLPRLIQYANSAVRDEGLSPEWRSKGIATTVVACALRGDQAYIAHVGDSRCYLIRDGHADSLTKDHTWVDEQVRQGLISEDEALTSESRHILTRTLGPERFVTADSTTVTIHPNDVLVLCSDGLYASLGAPKMAHLAARNSKNPQSIANNLVHEAITIDGSDNATALVICVRSVESMAMYRGRTYVRRRV